MRRRAENNLVAEDLIKTVTVTHVVDIDDFADGWNIITTTVGLGGELLVLLLEQSPDYRTKGGISANLFARKPNRFRICRLSNDSINSVDLTETHENYHHIQPLGDDRWLLVRGRSNSRGDHNAHLYAADGEHLSSFPAGDGIQDVQTTSEGDIWISYFDEGVFGDDEISHNGLVCLNGSGQITFTYPSVCGVPEIADCYALNVAYKDEVWLYYYTDFPLVRLRKKQFNHLWPDLPVKGAHAFAVSKDRVLFAGGYQKKKSLFLVSLFPLAVQELRPVSSADDVITDFTSFGRGSRLYLQQGTVISVIDVDEVW